MTLAAKTFSRGTELSWKTTDYIPATARIRPLRDQLFVEPIDAMVSTLIVLIEEKKPVRGIVRAAGPGVYPIQYDHADKRKRTKMWWGKHLRPCDVQVGDIVDFEPREFQTVYHGNKILLIIREEDVCFIVEKAHGQAA